MTRDDRVKRVRREQNDSRPGAGMMLALRLYVAGETANSLLAWRNLQIALGALDGPTPAVDIIDVVRDIERALADEIIVTPTLHLQRGEHRTTIIGTLDDLTALRRLLSGE